MNFMAKLWTGDLIKKVVAVALLCMNGIAREPPTSLANASSTPTFRCPPGLFSFGTSLSDTGNVPFAFPFVSRSENLPYGETFFGQNALRFSNGRLVIDFFALAFSYPLLTPYLQDIAPNFRRGVNFAASGATAISEAPEVPFYLAFQVAQFLRFRQNTLVANKLPELSFLTNNLLPSKSTFDEGLYILSFGRNDLSYGYQIQGFTPATAIATLVPQIVQSMVDGIQTLFEDGARSFLVSNVPPQGCSPQFLTMFGPQAYETDFDDNGCLTPFNEVNQVLNNQLRIAVENLRTTLNGSFILYFDYYAANIAVLQNPQSFGFASGTLLEACCGVGGLYNYNPDVLCSLTGSVDNITVSAKPCSNPGQYINWDGIHFTDAFNRVIAQLLLTGKFLDPPLDLKTLCKLDFTNFSGVNFTQAYPDGYLIVPPPTPIMPNRDHYQKFHHAETRNVVILD